MLSLFSDKGVSKSSVRAIPHSKAQLMHLALSGPSIRRKCHESVMSLVMDRGETLS